ncbi:MAG TPA: PAS domain S-box protein [Verrucomicrobiae bacterium]|nr:PAS domain S-box protein [Verrucomicrobiae bacterium]
MGSLVATAMVAVVGLRAFSALNQAIGWRQRTVTVIFATQSFQDNLLNLQRNLREYVTSGDTNALLAFQSAVDRQKRLFSDLTDLTLSNPAQQQRLKTLAAALRDVTTYDDRMTAIFLRDGTQAAIDADLSGSKNRAVFGRANEIIDAFSAEEEQLLQKRDAAEQANYHEAERLLLTGSVLAATLLILSSIIAVRELDSRHRAEAKLSRALTLQNAILNSAEYGIVTTGRDGIVQSFNPAAERMLGYSAAEVVGRQTPELWRDPKELEKRVEVLSRVLGRPVASAVDTLTAKVQERQVEEAEWTFIRKDGSRFQVLSVISAMADAAGNFTGFVGIFRDITLHKALEAEREKLIQELQQALAEVKTLSGLIPICGWCKSVRNDAGYWQSVEHYVRAHTEATFTHGICPHCQEKFKADIARANRHN